MTLKLQSLEQVQKIRTDGSVVKLRTFTTNNILVADDSTTLWILFMGKRLGQACVKQAPFYDYPKFQSLKPYIENFSEGSQNFLSYIDWK